MKKIRLGIIGAGALTEGVYLPVLQAMSLFELTVIVDVNLDQAKQLASQYHVPTVLQSSDAVTKEMVDAVLLVLPNFLHASYAVSFIQKGIHVLVEKPMANTVEECEQIIEAQERHKEVVVAVGLIRRFYPSTQFIRMAVQHQMFGKLLSFDWQEGHVLDWKLQSDYLLRKEKAGGGVLMDTGVHMLDQMIYCIGIPDELEYYDDSKGGAESDCKLVLKKGSIHGLMRFSRIRTLTNKMKLVFEHARVEVGLLPHSELKIIVNDLEVKAPALLEQQLLKVKDAFGLQLQDFGSAILNQTSARVSALDGKDSVALINRCYAFRKPIQTLEQSF